MTSTLVRIDPRQMRVHPVTEVDGAGHDCPQCDREGCVIEAQMYYTSMFADAPRVSVGSMDCLAQLWDRDADRDAPTTIEVQR
jgi:hypothetical protein